ncbi:MAG TPA: hypothetical protein VHR45_18655 [Thermoanaerobaculia bacterium]|nr:hypothetical protein [Thermoanaerobaculia bacterium]
MTRSDKERVPWPGPRPYREDEWQFFFGRNSEVREVYRRVVAHRLSLLSGGSGAGKTSLLRAGVVPLLRLRRYRVDTAKEERRKEWPVLVLRDWGTARGANLPEMIVTQMTDAAEAFDFWSKDSEQAQNDKQIVLRAIRAAGDNIDIHAIVEEICKEAGGLILVFDQLEEILRAGEQTAKRVTENIREFFESELPLRLLLSLRIEHIADLRQLENQIGGLVARTFFLAPMAQQEIREVIRDASSVVNAVIEDRVVDQILEWLRKGGPRRGQEEPAEPDGMSGPDLLSLQAVLRELYLECGGLSEAPIVVDETCLECYREKYGPEPAVIAGNALQRWITRALDENPSARGDGRLEESELTGLVHRIAVRLAPHLSSGDFKVALEQSDLFRKSLGDEIWDLGLNDPGQRQKIRILDGDALNTPELALSCERNAENLTRLSGAALESKWGTPAATADVLFVAFRETLRRLQKGNILKPIFSPTVRMVNQAGSWELVHDRLGRAFTDWAESRRGTWDDCLSSLVTVRGVSPILIRPLQRAGASPANLQDSRDQLRYLHWEGCVIAPLDGKQAVFESVEFYRCRLQGSIFKSCVFIGGGFRGCQLDGVMFRDCEFWPDSKGDPFTISGEKPSSLGILASTCGALAFEGCQLTQLTLHNLALAGPISFTGGNVVLSRLTRLRPKKSVGGPRKWVLFSADCGVYYCSGDASSWELVELERGCKNLNNGPLPPGVAAIG